MPAPRLLIFFHFQPISRQPYLVCVLSRVIRKLGKAPGKRVACNPNKRVCFPVESVRGKSPFGACYWSITLGGRVKMKSYSGLLLVLAFGLGTLMAIPAPAADPVSKEQISKLIEKMGSGDFEDARRPPSNSTPSAFPLGIAAQIGQERRRRSARPVRRPGRQDRETPGEQQDSRPHQGEPGLQGHSCGRGRQGLRQEERLFAQSAGPPGQTQEPQDEFEHR